MTFTGIHTIGYDRILHVCLHAICDIGSFSLHESLLYLQYLGTCSGLGYSPLFV